MNSTLLNYCKSLEVQLPDKERINTLTPLLEYLRGTRPLHLNFICTHNSRRSQFAQVWAQIAAHYYGVSAHSYSGGVEVTACNPRTIAALERCGLKTEIVKEHPSNPEYLIHFSEETESVRLFSKLYDDAANPKGNFAAIMTCSHADENCPFIPGTEARIALNYEDPKAFDDTEEEERAYDERCRQIALEMFYAFKAAKNED